jgi:UDP-N-acetylbacillosamine alanyltransferase
MKVTIERDTYPPEFERLFPPCRRDFCFEAAVQSAIESEWYSIMVTDGGHAFAHVVAPKPIPGTPWCDVEPFMGYTGFLTTSNKNGFLREALAAYSEACRSLRIIAELVRFNPILGNHWPYLGREELEVVAAKSIVVVSCERDEQQQIGHFSRSRRRDLRRGLRELQSRLLDKSSEIDLFRQLYERLLERAGAAPHWRFGNKFYAKVAACPAFEIQSVWSGNRLAAAALIGAHSTAYHYVLAANAEDYPPGAGERLIYEVARRAAENGCRQLVLGGGVTAAPDDSLLLFKARFAREPVTFFIGKMVHDRAKFEEISATAVAARPELANGSYFLKHRLVTPEKGAISYYRDGFSTVGRPIGRREFEL